MPQENTGNNIGVIRRGTVMQDGTGTCCDAVISDGTVTCCGTATHGNTAILSDATIQRNAVRGSSNPRLPPWVVVVSPTVMQHFATDAVI